MALDFSLPRNKSSSESLLNFFRAKQWKDILIVNYHAVTNQVHDPPTLDLLIFGTSNFGNKKQGTYDKILTNFPGSN